MNTVLMIPGFTGSSPGHWQSLWEREHPEYVRVQQRDWDHPDPVEWVAGVERAVAEAPDSVVLVGHSLGCTVIARFAAECPSPKVIGALLVAPSDVEAPTAPPEVRCFAPIPLAPLPFRSVVVASTNDEFVSLARAEEFARRWRARFVSIGAAGHIHTAAGYGPWPEGKRLLRELLEDAKGPAPQGSLDRGKDVSYKA
ncbi:MAG TPA: alpha/beta hydrolase [Gemmatimonadota bacterium]